MSPQGTQTPLQKQFGQRVRDLRKERGLALEELADRASLHWTYVGQVERGVRNPTLKNIAALAAALGVPIADLFQWQLAA